MKVNSILCPIDFSKTSDAAVVSASKLARRYGAKLHLVHVYEPVFADGYMEGMPMQPPPADLDAIRARLEAIRPAGGETIECHHELIFGFPGGSIVGYAASNDIDLIVMGTHGRSGPSRLLMGSVAEAVMRAASCPVLVVHDAPKNRLAG
jgi:nucleotide-binding universal stress UspA family protein